MPRVVDTNRFRTDHSAVIRFLINTAIMLAANAVGLIIAANLLDDMSLDTSGFLLALGIFTLVVVAVAIERYDNFGVFDSVEAAILMMIAYKALEFLFEYVDDVKVQTAPCPN